MTPNTPIDTSNEGGQTDPYAVAIHVAMSINFFLWGLLLVVAKGS